MSSGRSKFFHPGRRRRSQACAAAAKRVESTHDTTMPRKKTRPDGGKREELIDAALRLFSRQGYRATGIDTILAEAGAAKMTLYHHFKSKDELIVAALQKRDAEWRAWFQRRVDDLADTPREKLRALFDVLEEWFRHGDYHGCSFGQAATEFREPGHAVHRMATEHKQRMFEYIRDVADQAGARNADLLARQLGLLMEGAIIHMEVFREPDVARTAADAAQKLVQAAIQRGRG
jgi:AcrR family transcriptional regulator